MMSANDQCSGGMPCENCASHGLAATCHYPMQHDVSWSSRQSPPNQPPKRTSPSDKSNIRAKRRRSHAEMSRLITPTPSSHAPTPLPDRQVIYFPSSEQVEEVPSYPIAVVDRRGLDVTIQAPGSGSGELSFSTIAPFPLSYIGMNLHPVFATTNTASTSVNIPLSSERTNVSHDQHPLPPHLASRPLIPSTAPPHSNSQTSYALSISGIPNPNPVEISRPSTSGVELSEPPSSSASRCTTVDSCSGDVDELMEEVQAPGGGPSNTVNGRSDHLHGMWLTL
jgi:hypothetical protein